MSGGAGRAAERPSRRALLRLDLDSLLGTRPGQPVAQEAHRGERPGCSAERGYDESAPPWMRASEPDP